MVDYKTPVYAKDAELYWATSIGSGYDVNACGCPILVDGAIYTYSGSRIYKVDAISGEILIDKPMDHNSSFAINPPTYANGMIFVGLSDGTIQAFGANTLDSCGSTGTPSAVSPTTLLSITMATSTPVFGWARSTRPTMCA